MGGSQTITEVEIRVFLARWFKMAAEKRPLAEQQSMFAPGCKIRGAGHVLSIADQIALHAGFSRETRNILDLTIESSAEGAAVRAEVYFEIHLAKPSDAAPKAIRVNMTEDWLIVRAPTEAGLQFVKYETSNLRYRPGSARLFE
jgi:hypothetical protein